MAFIKSKKIYAILCGDPDGKKIVDEASKLTDEELERKIDEFFNNHKPKAKVSESISAEIEDQDETIKSSIEYAMENSITAIKQRKNGGVFYASTGELYYDKKKEDKTVFFHEMGHAVDYALGGGKPISTTYISEEFGKTMKDVYSDELANVNWAELEQEVSGITVDTSKLNEERYQISKEIKRITEENSKDNKIQMMNDIKALVGRSGEITTEELNDCIVQYVEQEMGTYEPYTATLCSLELAPKVLRIINEEKNKSQEEANNLPEVKKLLARDEEIENEIKELHTAYRSKVKAYSSISDVYSYYTKNSKNKLGLKGVNVGHPTNYWKKDQDSGVKELFAEFFEGKSINLKSYSVLKRYLPNSAKVFEEILKKGKGKENE